MPLIALECADLTATVDPDLGCGLVGLWRDLDGRRVPLVPVAPVPHTRPSELLARWTDADRCAPIAIRHRTPLSIAWRWPDGATARWELGPGALIASWSGVGEFDTGLLEAAVSTCARPTPTSLLVRLPARASGPSTPPPPPRSH